MAHDHVNEASYLLVRTFRTHYFQHSVTKCEAHVAVIADYFTRLQVRIPRHAEVKMLFGGRVGCKLIKYVRFSKHAKIMRGVNDQVNNLNLGKPARE